MIKFIWNLVKRPSKFLAYCMAFLLGSFYIVWYKVTRHNVTIRFPFLCHDKVDICGPGKVFIDSRCQVWMNTFDHLVIMTLSPDAEVHIGKNCDLGGLTIRCRKKVDIGDNVLAAANLIQDIPIVNENEINSKMKKYKPSTIMVGNNVWMAAQSLILGESRIGNQSVLGMNALLYNSTVSNDCLCFGNPTTRPISIDKLSKLIKTKKS